MLPQLTRLFLLALLLSAVALSWPSLAQNHTPSKALSGPVGLEGSFLDPFQILLFNFNQIFEEDETYKDLCLEGDNIRGTRSPFCIPHRRTRAYSTLNLSPWYLTNIQCQAAAGSCVLEVPQGPYLGPLYRGDENVYRYINRLVQPTQDSAVDVCRRIIIPNSDVVPYDPVIARMELDSCANQYILFRSDLPLIAVDDQGELPDVFEANDVDQESDELNLERGEKFCQPMRMVPINPLEAEYTPSEYFVEAWRKTMMDPGWLARQGDAPKEPFYGGLGIGLEETIPIRLDYGIVSINDLVEPWGEEHQYERIYDPTHPFTPRWDFEYNERDEFSPRTIIYLGDPVNSVHCAGDQFINIIKTDVLNWREPAFKMYMDWRIQFNTICWLAQFIPPVFWDCFGDFEATPFDPPCPTKFYGEEKVESALGTQAREILCGTPHIEELCEHITKPVVPANALKLREHNGENFPYGTPRGYTFEEYFGDHRPYMRCWDTGRECGRDLPEVYGEGVIDPYLFYGTAGANYSLMGVGREGESCGLGGGKGLTASQVDGEADPILDWMEFKLYALRGMRKAGINCVTKHEMLFKIGTGEEIIANRAGGMYQKTTPDTEGINVRYSTFPWPLQWRGYVSDPLPAWRYPNFNVGLAPLRGIGLDNAREGDILIFDQDVVQPCNAPGTWRLPYIAFVTEACNEASDCPPAPSHYVNAVAYNHGKFPDVCGNTDSMEMGEEYTMFKGELPAYTTGLFEAAGPHTTTCDDPFNSVCTENHWDAVKLYYPKFDQRR